MKKYVFHHCLLAWLMGSALAGRPAEVRFERAHYFAQANEAITVRLVFDADETLEGDQLPAQGFFSVGAAVGFPAGSVSTSEDAVKLPPALDGDGVGNPPPKEVTPSRAGAAGAVDILGDGSPHTNVVFLTVTLTNLAGPGSFLLTSELFFADPLNNFVSGTGEPLDGTIHRFGSATVHVLAGVPSPVIAGLTSVSSNQWRMVFEDPNGVPEVYEIQRASDLNAPIQWEAVAQASIQVTGPGTFEAVMDDAAPQRFFRIRTLYPDPL